MPYQKKLDLLFPSCDAKKENIFLDKKQTKALEKVLDKKIYSKLALRFKVTCKDKSFWAYVDSHIVRTLNETVVVVINKNDQIRNYEISSFMEPQEYKPAKRWLKQLLKLDVSKTFRLGYEIDALSGATLSARASVNTSKKILHLHQILSKTKL